MLARIAQAQRSPPERGPLSDSEWEAVEKAAAERGMNAAEFARHATLGVASGRYGDERDALAPQYAELIERIFRSTGAELLFEIFSQRYEQASTLVTSNLPFNEWTEIFGSERLTGALLDRLTHHVHILELNGDSYRLAHSKHVRHDAAAPPS